MSQSPSASLSRRAVKVGLFAAVLGAFFYWGRLSGIAAFGDLHERNNELASQINQQTIALREAKSSNVRLAKAAEVDRLAAEEVRRELLTYRQEAASLQRDVEFFRSLMAPDELERGLRLHSFSVDYDEELGRYSYKAVIINAGGKGNVIKGQLKFSLIAASDSGNREFAFNELPEFQGNVPVKLRFRFFQNIQGSFKLPENYQPVSIHASANVKDKAGAYFKASYRWGNLMNHDVSGDE